ncbi:PAS domain S-box protein [Nitrospira sp. Nam74]
MSKSGRDLTTIHQEIDNLRHRVSLLQEQADRDGGASSTTVSTLIEELHIAVAELLTNEEEFRMKQEQWADVQERLRRECQHYEDLFEHAPDAYLVTTAAGVIQKANVPASALLERQKGSLVGKPLLVFVADTHKRAYLDQLNRLKTRTDMVVRDWVLQIQPTRGTSLSASVNVSVQRDSRKEVVTLRWSMRETFIPS